MIAAIVFLSVQGETWRMNEESAELLRSVAACVLGNPAHFSALGGSIAIALGPSPTERLVVTATGSLGSEADFEAADCRLEMSPAVLRDLLHAGANPQQLYHEGLITAHGSREVLMVAHRIFLQRVES